MTFFLLGSFFLISTCRSCHYLSLDWVPSLPLLALGYVYVGKGRTTICLELNHISVSFAFPRQLFGQMESINGTGACRRQEMLTQGPAPDPKCKLNILLLLRLPHLLDCLICTRNSMSIALLLLQMMVGQDRQRVVYLY